MWIMLASSPPPFERWSRSQEDAGCACTAMRVMCDMHICHERKCGRLFSKFEIVASEPSDWDAREKCCAMRADCVVVRGSLDYPLVVAGSAECAPSQSECMPLPVAPCNIAHTPIPHRSLSRLACTCGRRASPANNNVVVVVVRPLPLV